MASISVMLLQAAAAVWSPPAQAAWLDDQPPIKVVLHAGPISMRGIAPLEVDLVATGNGFSISPFLQTTRGIAFEVTKTDGEQVDAAEPMIGSPPPPPLQSSQLVAVTPTSSDRVMTKERARTIFPQPGSYRVKAHLFCSISRRSRSGA
jgi:hypothetical protein